MPWISTETPATNCPACGAELDRASMHAERKPVPGDYSVCLYCGSFLRFDSSMRAALITIEDVAALPDDDRNTLVRLRKACATFRLRYGVKGAMRGG